MIQQKYDAIVIGGGHNGLTCAGYLAKAGLKTVVLEQRSVLGGAAVSEETVPGFSFSTFSYGLANLNLNVINDFELRKFGLKSVPQGPLFIPMDDDTSLVYRHHDIAKTQAQFARFSKRDAERYPEFLAYMKETGDVVRNLYLETPIDPVRQDWKSFKKNASFLWKYRKIGNTFYRMVDMMTMSADEFLSQWFESGVIRAIWAYWAGIGGFIGPMSPGSASVVMYYLISEDLEEVPRGYVIGGMGSITQALAKSIARFGVDIKTDSTVTNVVTRNGRVAGVVTQDGTEYSADLVVSNAHCKILFDNLIEEKHLPSDFLEEIRKFKTFSGNFKINVACEAPPSFKAFDKQRTGLEFVDYAHIGPNIEYLEHAYDEAKYGSYSSRPWLTTTVPSCFDKTVAPEGKHVVNVFGGYAPYDLKGKSWDSERDKFIKIVLGTLDEFAPGFSESIIDMQVLLPTDIERILNLPNGHILHGEMSMDQMFFMRPAPHYADYRSPIHGLYQCGSSCHPGGGVTGVPGRNAAREVLYDLGKPMPTAHRAQPLALATV